jgi:DNA-binding transcriptional ArsR family regulator
MAFQKTEHFSDAHNDLARFAHTLAHPARIAIICILQEKGEACCGELVEALPLAQPTISQHLRCLREVGLLHQRNCGPKICYSLNCDAMRSFCHSFQCTLGTDEPLEPVESTCCES